MPFEKNSKKTKDAGRKGGITGVKHLQTLSPAKLKALTSKAGKASAAARKAKKEQQARLKLDKKAEKYGDKIMHSYHV